MKSTGDSAGIYLDARSPSPVLAVAFGGISGKFANLPPFEFIRALDRIAPAKKLFLRDREQSWYHRGVQEGPQDIPTIKREIESIASDLKPEKIVMLGLSAGGYAALLFGRLIEAVDEVHAFSPQTFISPELRRLHNDRRWREELNRLMDSRRYEPRYGDLYTLFEHTRTTHTRFLLHYSSTFKLDAIHAEHLGRHPQVELRGHPGGGHNIAKHLRDNGELHPLLEDALTL